MTNLVVVAAGLNIGSKGHISVDLEVSSLKNPDKSVVKSIADYKKIELMRKNVRSQVTNELVKFLKKQVSSKVEVFEVSKNVYGDAIYIALSYR